MNAFANWFEWPMRVNGKFYSTDLELRSILTEIWLLRKSDAEFYYAWQEGIRCGRIYEVKDSTHETFNKAGSKA